MSAVLHRSVETRSHDLFHAIEEQIEDGSSDRFWCDDPEAVCELARTLAQQLVHPTEEMKALPYQERRLLALANFTQALEAHARSCAEALTADPDIHELQDLFLEFGT